jgi:hypothetical protein
MGRRHRLAVLPNPLKEDCRRLPFSGSGLALIRGLLPNRRHLLPHPGQLRGISAARARIAGLGRRLTCLGLAVSPLRRVEPCPHPLVPENCDLVPSLGGSIADHRLLIRACAVTSRPSAASSRSAASPSRSSGILPLPRRTDILRFPPAPAGPPTVGCALAALVSASRRRAPARSRARCAPASASSARCRRSSAASEPSLLARLVSSVAILSSVEAKSASTVPAWFSNWNSAATLACVAHRSASRRNCSPRSAASSAP